MRIERTIETDVLVIGGGGAALRAAVAARDHGAEVAIVLKGKLGTSGATVSPDSPAVAWQLADQCAGSEDSPEVHFRNIVDVGLGMADPKLARIVAYETPEQTEQLEGWGLQFIPNPKDPSRHYSGYSCFGDQPRAHGIANTGYGHAGDIVRVLGIRLKQQGVTVHQEILITDLIVVEGRCAGALGLGPSGELIVFKAGAVVMGAGGARQIYPLEPRRTRIDTTGDSYAMALRAGAELTNMEFTQYMLHPVLPWNVIAPGVYWSLCPLLKNRHGDDALAPYLPKGVTQQEVFRQRTEHYPFSTRDCSKWLDIAFGSEIRAGRGTDEGGLYLDFSNFKRSEFIPARPQHHPDDHGDKIELPSEPAQVRPMAHAINGGVLINERGESSLPGLFAAAEAAAGPHGADRLGGGMVSNGQVFGARAGKFAAQHAASCKGRAIPEPTLKPLIERLKSFGKGNRNPEDVLTALQQATGKKLIVLRNQAGLESLLGDIRDLKRNWLPNIAVPDTAALKRAVEVTSALITVELMAQAAVLRKESRGGHYREDHPEQNDTQWRASIIFRQNGEGVRITKRSLEAEAGRRVDEQLGTLV